MNKNIIVSSADENYFNLLRELYLSAQNLKGFDFAVLNCGLSDQSKSFFIEKSACLHTLFLVNIVVGNLAARRDLI